MTACLAARGAKVVLAARHEDTLGQLAQKIRVGQALGGFDTWLNNAGVSVFGRIEDVPVADMRNSA